MTTLYSQCQGCKHLEKQGWKCKAFPEEVPQEIIFNEFDHRKEYEGDGGVRWEPRDDLEQWEEDQLDAVQAAFDGSDPETRAEIIADILGGLGYDPGGSTAQSEQPQEDG